MTFTYKLAYDTESDHDFVYVESEIDYDTWVPIATYSGRGDTTASHTVYPLQAITKFRFRFLSDGAWSDQDGLFDSDGACIVDSLVVSDATGVRNYQNFEAAAVGEWYAGSWAAGGVGRYGTYSGLGKNLVDHDPCGENLSSQIMFFYRSPSPSSSYPGLYDTPPCNNYYEECCGLQCQDEYVVSPVIDMARYSTGCNNVQDGTIPAGDLPALGGSLLRFTVYAENPIPNLVFYRWAVRNVVDGCPGPWLDDDILYWYFETGYIFQAEDVSRFLSSDSVQIAVGVADLCGAYYPYYGDCSGHTPAPWFDNVRLYRYQNAGPQWSFRALDLFQDNFPGDEGTLESHVRADAAIDINASDNPVIRPGDSIVVSCAAPRSGGIASDPAGGPAVYLHVKCSYVGPSPTKPALAGPSLQGTYGTYRSDDGVWTIIQGDTARIGGEPVSGAYMFDLNDGLFTRGYLIEYYFTARSVDALESALPKWGRSGEPYFEWTCLPTLNGSTLFVDDSYSLAVGRPLTSPVETYWWSFVLEDYINGPPDRYHVNGASSAVSNGPGSRAKNAQMTDAYDLVIWDAGDMIGCTISEGTIYSDKSDDCRMLIDWMTLSEHRCGLWVCGDGIAADLHGSISASAISLMRTWCGVVFIHDSYFELTGGFSSGGVVNPLVTGSSELGLYVADTFYVSGSCPVINDFDVLGITANGAFALSYPDFGGDHYHAAVGSTNLNANGDMVRTMWFGFSYQHIRDDDNAPMPDRAHIAYETFAWILGAPYWHSSDAAEPPKADRLAQNFPNPFNPSTTIRYDVKAKGHVTIRVFDVSGRLVRTLVEGVKDAGSYSASWDGANNLGARAASGVYFCRMQTGDFEADRKLVLLK